MAGVDSPNRHPEPSRDAHAKRPDGYIPAAGHDWFLPLYDPVLRWLMREDVFKQRLVRDAGIRPGDRVLDLGCGTATLTLLVKRLQPGAYVYGVDGDRKVLRIAADKVARGPEAVGLVEGLANQLPHPGSVFDRALSSLMIHHLSHDEKLQTFKEVWRVLKPGGSIHVVDFGPPVGIVAKVFAALAHRNQRLRENLEGRLPALLAAAGFERAEEYGHHQTPFGRLSFVRGFKKPV